MAGGPSIAGSSLIDDFRTLDAWSVSSDGGTIEISPDATHTLGGKPSMRLHFPYGRYQWGNARKETTLPPNATGIEFDLFVNYAKAPASLFIWLMEKDGDGHLATIEVEGKSLHELSAGWYHCFVPISRFRYEPRGNKVRELLTTSRMLIGMNNGEAEVSIANLTFRTADRSAGMTLARTPNLAIQEGPKGRVAVLSDAFPEKPSLADPKALAKTLSDYGYGVTLLKAGDLADPAILTTGNFDCLILPYGPYYPFAASDAIKAYLKSGGSFLSTGGYAFDAPCVPDGSGRLAPAKELVEITAEDFAKGDMSRGMNTRYGKPGDTLGLEPDQIGVFDPCYHLNNAAVTRAAPMQSLIPETLSFEKALEGYSACSLLGSNSPVFPEKWGRHIPLANALDSGGRLVGSVGAIARNFAGPYAKSSWAFFGVTNLDLFAKDGPMLPHLGPIVDALVRKAYLHSLTTDMACYKDGEWVIISCKLANYGRAPISGEVSFSIYDRNGKLLQEIPPMDASADANSTADLETEWRPLKFDSDLYRIVAKLSVDGKMIDALETGFAAYDPKTIAAGMKLKLEGNYFRDGDRPLLLSGTNVTGAIFFSANENPLVWERDLVRMSDCGVNILRVLHFSPFLSAKPSVSSIKPLDLNVDALPRKIERQLDALVHLCQKHKIALFLTIHDWMPVELSDKELQAQRKYAETIARRYKNVPGFMIDIQNEPHLSIPTEAPKDESPDIARAWNDFLRAKYGSDHALRAAWRISPPEGLLGSIPRRKGTDAWDDMRTFDADAFRNVLLNRWAEANASGAKSGDPDMPVTIGFLQEYFALNKLLCVDKLDFANMHSYTGINVLRADLKLFDRRFQGKSLSLGEFGSVADHERRVSGADSGAQDFGRFLLTGHYVFGLGGSFLANWSWKDMDDVVFPWGIVYPCGGPKKQIAKAYRNQSLLFRRVKPVYEPEEVFLVVPAHQMLGGQSAKCVQALYEMVQALLSEHVDFGTIDDAHLDQLPPTARVLVYPIPFAIPDEAYPRLRAFVERGGILCVTGDVSYDRLRRRTHLERLEDLCGVRLARETYPGVGWDRTDSPCIEVERLRAHLENGIWVNDLGAGKVCYSPSPSGKAGETMVFSAALDSLGKRAFEGPPSVHGFRIHEADGSCTYVVVNSGDSPETMVIRPMRGDEISLPLEGNGVGLARLDAFGKLLAVECQGPFTLADGRVIGMTGHFALISADGEDLGSSGELIAIPFGEGELDLSALTGDFVVQTGDVLLGKWRSLSESRDMVIVAARETAFDIRIIAPKDHLTRLGDLIASELTLSPKN